MAKKKTTISDLWDDFEAVQKRLGEDVRLLPMGDDDSKCVLLAHSKCLTFSCSALKGHLEFLRDVVPQ